MNPDNHFNLPPPVAESPVPALAEVDAPVLGSEQMRVASPEVAGNHVATPPPAVLSRAAQQAISDLQPATDQPAATSVQDQSQSAVQADNEDFDRVLVMKAKQIVNQTMDNPYEQHRQLAAVKAEFIQTHYGKTVKLAE